MTAPRPIFIHGSGGGTFSWDQQEPRFEGGYVVALPGHPAGLALPSVAAYAEWLVAAIADIPGPHVLVGHSLGGAIALQVALDQPELASGIVMIASGPRLTVPEAAFASARADFPAECRRILSKGWPGASEETIAAEAERMEANGQETLLRDYAASAGFDAGARLAEVRMPVLVIAGDADRLTPVALGREVASGVRAGLMAIVPDAGHWVMKEAAATVDLLLAGFLARLELTDG